MHNFVVPHRYKYQTRIGNWSEEWELEDVKYMLLLTLG